jgi:hypothetical protein
VPITVSRSEPRSIVAFAGHQSSQKSKLAAARLVIVTRSAFYEWKAVQGGKQLFAIPRTASRCAKAPRWPDGDVTAPSRSSPRTPTLAPLAAGGPSGDGQPKGASTLAFCPHPCRRFLPEIISTSV